MLNEYIGEHLGNGFTAKDFRTWGGTLLAAVELAKHGPAASETEAKRVLASGHEEGRATSSGTRPPWPAPRT